MWPLYEAIKLAQEDQKISFMSFFGIETIFSIPLGLTVDTNFLHGGCDLLWWFEYAGKLDVRATDFSLPVLPCSYLHNACKKLRHSAYFLKADKCSFILSIIMVYYMHSLLLWKQLNFVPKYRQHPVFYFFIFQYDHFENDG